MAEINPETGGVTVEPGEAVIVEGAPAALDEGGEIGGISDAVAVAAIEGETRVEIATIDAETEQARIAADIERERLWRDERIAALEASLTERDRTIAELETRLTPPPLLEAPAEEAALTMQTETISIPQSTLDEIAEIPMEATPESEEERPEERAAHVHRRRPI